MSKNKTNNFASTASDKVRLRTIYLARITGMIFLFFLFLILSYVLVNYFFVLTGYLKDTIQGFKSQTTAAYTDFSFKLRYLISVPDSVPGWLPYALAVVITLTRGWWVVKKIEQIIKNRQLDYAWNDVEGSARWATTAEIKNVLQTVSKKDLHSAERAGIILCEDQDNYYVDTSTSHTIISGKTRSGKDQFIILPTARFVIECKEKPSLVFTDPKLELYEYLYPLLKENGYRIWILNFRDPEKGMSCSDLAPCIREYKRAMETDPEERDFSRTSDKVGEFAYIQTLNPKSDPVWPECAKSLLQAMIFYLLDVGYQNGTLDDLNMYTVRTFFIDMGTKECKLPNGTKTVELDKIMQSLPIRHPAWQAYASSRFAEGEARSSIYFSLSADLDLYGDTGIAKMTTGRAEDPMSFEDLANPDIPTALFLGIPDDRKNRDKMATTFINQIYTELVEVAQKYQDNRLPRRVILFADEVGTLPAFPNFDSMLQVSLGRNIMWYFAVQNLAQLEKTYGDKEARIIRDSASNYVYLYSSDMVIVKEVSELLGMATKAFTTTSGQQGSWLEAEHAQSHMKGRSLMMSDELRLLQEGEFIVFHDRFRPMKSKVTPFWKLGYKRIGIDKTEYSKAPKMKMADLLMPYERTCSDGARSAGKRAADPDHDDCHRIDDGVQTSQLIIAKQLQKLTGGKFLPALDTDINLARRLAVEQNDLGGISAADLAIIQALIAEAENENAMSSK